MDESNGPDGKVLSTQRIYSKNQKMKETAY